MAAVLVIHRPDQDFRDLLNRYQEDENGQGWWDYWQFRRDEAGNVTPPPGRPVSDYKHEEDDYGAILTEEDGLIWQFARFTEPEWQQFVETLLGHYQEHVMTVPWCHS